VAGTSWRGTRCQQSGCEKRVRNELTLYATHGCACAGPSPGPRPSPVFRSAICDCLSLNVSICPGARVPTAPLSRNTAPQPRCRASRPPSSLTAPPQPPEAGPYPRPRLPPDPPTAAAGIRTRRVPHPVLIGHAVSLRAARGTWRRQPPQQDEVDVAWLPVLSAPRRRPAPRWARAEARAPVAALAARRHHVHVSGGSVPPARERRARPGRREARADSAAWRSAEARARRRGSRLPVGLAEPAA
jgi:hypothetical protein